MNTHNHTTLTLKLNFNDDNPSKKSNATRFFIDYISFVLGFYPSSLLFPRESVYLPFDWCLIWLGLFHWGACRLSKFGVKSKSKTCKNWSICMGNACYAEFCVICTRTHCPFITPKLSELRRSEWAVGTHVWIQPKKGERKPSFPIQSESILQVLIFGIALNLLTLHAPHAVKQS